MDNNHNLDQNPDTKSNSDQKTTLFRLNKNDGILTITYSEGNIEARGDFIPPAGDGQLLTAEYVSEALEKFNINHGVYWENIHEALMAVLGADKPVKDILIARGERAIPEVPGYYEIDPSLINPGLPSLDIPRVDYKSISPFTMVKKDQVLAVLKDPVEGQDGINIHGEVIQKETLHIKGVAGGQNTRTEDNKIISNLDGRLINNDGVLMVDEVLVIKGKVGYATGHISFPGDVIIEGSVADGFKVFSGGSVLAKETLDATEVIAKKDLIVNGGIIGHGRALLKISGNVKARFIRNCRMAVKGEIHIESEIVNSSVFTLQSLNMGDKGSIVGGEIYAVHGIKAAGLGKMSGKSTRIHCGIDFTVQQELEKMNYQLRLITGKQQKLKEIIASSPGAAGAGPKIEELSTRLQEEYDKVYTRITELLSKLNADENAIVEVKGEIAPGTVIDICDVALYVDHPIRKARIKLSKEQGKLISGPIT